MSKWIFPFRLREAQKRVIGVSIHTVHIAIKNDMNELVHLVY